MKHGESFSPPQDPNTPRGGRFARLYMSSAVITLNTLIFLVLVNVVLGVAIWSYDRYHLGEPERTSKPKANAFFYQDGAPIDNGKRSAYQLDFYDFTACEGISPEEAAAVQDDYFGHTFNSFIYQPWVLFSEAPYQSPHLNVLWDDAGFPRRRTANPANPDKLPEIVVWTFGGSTTFGYWVADWETWSSFLSQKLNDLAQKENLGVRIRVESYGRAAYEPNQEVILLWNLLRSGQRPSLVIFMDGVNTGGAYDYPLETGEVSKVFHLVQKEGLYHWPWTSVLRDIPMVRLAGFLEKKLRGAKAPAPIVPEEQLVRWISNRFKDNWQLAGELCRRYGADLIVCLQPCAFYQYDFSLFRFPINDQFRDRGRQAEAIHTTLRRETDCLYLGDLFKEWGHRRKAVLTECHYTPGFNKFLAENLAAHIDLKKLSVSPGYLPQEATGAPLPQDLGQY
jgi:hypothetical protein